MTVFLLLSGGLDSSVAGYLLKKKGFDLVCCFLDLFNPKNKKDNSKQMAQRIAKKLKSKFLILDLKKEFKKEVIEKTIKYYKKNLTPNPCMICNQKIKFGKAFSFFLKQKYDFFATGHYAKIKKQKDKYSLFEAKDKLKDQSYFLYHLDQKKLKKIIFPLGELKKEKVIEIAKKNNLFLKEIKESQEICFLEKTDIREFLLKKLGKKEGKIFEIETKKFLGYHPGFWFFTLGQRSGLNLSSGPYFIVKKDAKKNILYVSKNRFHFLIWPKKVVLKKLSFIDKDFLKKRKFEAKIVLRHHQSKIKTKVFLEKNKGICFLKKRVFAPVQGQYGVFYKNSKVIGGGMILN